MQLCSEPKHMEPQRVQKKAKFDFTRLAESATKEDCVDEVEDGAPVALPDPALHHHQAQEMQQQMLLQRWQQHIALLSVHHHAQ
jgi:hypothetical protein